MDDVWRIASSARVTLILIALLVLSSALAATFPQQPSGLEARAAARWLDATATSAGRFGPLLRSLGLFGVMGGIGQRVLLAALAYNLALRLAAQAQQAWRAWRGSDVLPEPPMGAAHCRITVSEPLTDAPAYVQNKLRARYREVTVRDEPPGVRAQESTRYVYAERRRFGTVGALLACAGPLLALLGLLVNSASGWRTSDVSLASGDHTTLRQAGGLMLTLDGISGDGGATTSVITATREDGTARQVRARPLLPARWGDLWILQRSTGAALSVLARDDRGRPLLLQALEPAGQASGELHIAFRPTDTEQEFAAPAQNLVFRVVSYPALPEKGIDRPVFVVEAYRGDDPTPVLRELVQDQADLTLADQTYVLRRDRYAVLEIGYLPGGSLVAAGILLMLLGLAIALAWRYTQAWVILHSANGKANGIVTAESPLGSRRELATLAQMLGWQALDCKEGEALDCKEGEALDRREGEDK